MGYRREGGFMTQFSTAQDVLRYYREDLADLVALAVVRSEAFPKQILNEIRAAFTHLARADNPTLSQKDRESEIDSSGRHLLRATMDCLKVVIIMTAHEADTVIRTLTQDKRLPEQVYGTAEDLRKRRHKLLANEMCYPIVPLVEEFTSLFAAYDSFLASLRNDYNGYHSAHIDEARFAERRRDTMKAFAVGFAASAIIAVLSHIIL